MGVGIAVGIVVQIMELANACKSGLQHFNIKLGCHGLHLVRVHGQRKAVHHLAPAPETISRRSAALSKASHAALESVTVKVGHAG